jgi:hypothetical protein
VPGPADGIAGSSFLALLNGAGYPGLP